MCLWLYFFRCFCKRLHAPCLLLPLYTCKKGAPSSQDGVSKVGFDSLFLDFFHLAQGWMTTLTRE